MSFFLSPPRLPPTYLSSHADPSRVHFLLSFSLKYPGTVCFVNYKPKETFPPLHFSLSNHFFVSFLIFRLDIIFLCGQVGLRFIHYPSLLPTHHWLVVTSPPPFSLYEMRFPITFVTSIRQFPIPPLVLFS